jgi:hypothetical protein
MGVEVPQQSIIVLHKHLALKKEMSSNKVEILELIYETQSIYSSISHKNFMITEIHT